MSMIDIILFQCYLFISLNYTYIQLILKAIITYRRVYVYIPEEYIHI